MATLSTVEVLSRQVSGVDLTARGGVLNLITMLIAGRVNGSTHHDAAISATTSCQLLTVTAAAFVNPSVAPLSAHFYNEMIAQCVGKYQVRLLNAGEF